MKRNEEIDSKIKKPLREKFHRTLERTKAEYRQRREALRREFLGEVDAVFGRMAAAQAAGQKSAAACFAIMVLQSSTLDKSYDFQLTAYDQSYYTDLREISAFWHPAFIFRSVGQDMEEVTRYMKAHVIRCREYELERWRRVYLNWHYALAGVFFRDNIDGIFALDSFQRLTKGGEFPVFFGSYMDNPALLGKYVPERKES